MYKNNFDDLLSNFHILYDVLMCFDDFCLEGYGLGESNSIDGKIAISCFINRFPKYHSLLDVVLLELKENIDKLEEMSSTLIKSEVCNNE